MRWLVGLTLLAGSTAHAGGLARPNAGSATGAGMGGAFAAIADDASALYVNPAGMAFATPAGLVSIAFVVAPRSYICEGDGCGDGGLPADPQPLAGKDQTATAIAPAPTLGILFRPGGKDSPMTLGVGAYNSFGGILHWEKFDNQALAALNASTELVFEVAAGVGWALDERVAIGAALRIGIGLFGVDATAKPVDTKLSANGVGLGVTAGILMKPTDKLNVGLGWRSNLDITTSGAADLEGIGDIDAEHVQKWPQSVSLSVAFRPQPALTLAAQVDWTQWSRFETLLIHFPAQPTLDQEFLLDWNDTFTFRLGAQYELSKKLQVRGGVLHDGNAVPDLTIERQYLDAPKYGLALGGSYALSDRMILDFGFDAVGGPPRDVPVTDLADVPAGWPEQRNIAPGAHSGSVFSLLTGLRIAL